MHQTITWVVENLVGEESYSELCKFADFDNMCELNVIKGDYIRKDIQELGKKHQNNPIVVLASIEICKLIKEDIPHSHIFATFENYLCSNYYSKYGKWLFNDHYTMMPLKEVKRQKWNVYKTFGKESLIFLRPDSGDKPFKASLVDLEEIDSVCDQFDDQLVVVSTPKNSHGEWRFVVNNDREIVAQSSYRFNGLVTRIPSAPKGATKLVQQILNETKVEDFPDPIFCLDIVADNDWNFWLMELTSFSSAGLYATNKQDVIDGVNKKILSLIN